MVLAVVAVVDCRKPTTVQSRTLFTINSRPPVTRPSLTEMVAAPLSVALEMEVERVPPILAVILPAAIAVIASVVMVVVVVTTPPVSVVVVVGTDRLYW